MALADIDRDLLERCLADKPQAWEDFVDRFLGLVVHVVNHTTTSKSLRLSAQDREDLISEVFLAILDNDLAVLRRFRGRSSLATYLTVVARRVVVRKALASISHTSTATHQAYAETATEDATEERIANADQVKELLTRLDGPEAQAVQMYHLEGKSYGEISNAMGVTENSIGPMLSRAREKMRIGIPQPPANSPGVASPADQPTG